MAKARKDTKETQNAVEMLTEDHRRVEKLIDEFEKSKPGNGMEDIVRAACNELKVHAQLEEEVFYPAVRAGIKEEDLIDEAEVEHTVAKQLIAELEAMSPDDELYVAKFTVLGEYVKHHVEEEEGEMFVQAKRAKIDMGELGEEMQRRKLEIQQELGYSPQM